MKKDFSRLAGIYKLLERLAFGHLLERVRYNYVADLKEAKRILLVGDGDGRFLKELLFINPSAEVLSVDNSLGMIQRARQRVGETHPRADVEWVLSDIRVQKLDSESFDAIVTCFVLDCFEADDVQRIAEKLVKSLKPKGLWLYADFQEPQGRGLQASVNYVILRFLYAYFRVVCGIRAKRIHEVNTKNMPVKIENEREWRGLLIARLFRK